MAFKLKPLSQEQKDIIRANGLKVHEWVVLQDLTYSMILRNWISGEVRVVEKNAGR